MALFIRTHNRCPSAATALPLYARRLLLVATVLAPFVAGAQTATPLSLQEALALAQSRSPQLVAQTAAIGAAESLAVSAGQLPDPKLGIGIDNLPVTGADQFSVGRDFMTMRKIGLMQEFPREEKRRANQARAVAETNKEQATLTALQTNLQRDVALAWLERYFAERQVQVLKELETETAFLYDAARAAVAGGKGSPADPVLAQAARVQVQDRIQEAERQMKRAQAMLARWVGEREASRPLDTAPSFSTVSHPLSALQQTLTHHPELLVYGPLEAIARADIASAQAAKKPDWSLEVAYAQRGSSFSNMVSVQVRIDLPVFAAKRQDPVIAARYKVLEQVQAQREDARRMHETDIKNMLIDWETARGRLKRSETELVPLARQGATAALAAYRSGRSNLTTALDARRNVIGIKVSEVQTQAELGRAWAYLNFLLPLQTAKVDAK